MLDNKDPMLSPEQQEQFWKLLTPDLRNMFSVYEMRESWTQRYDELPEFYAEMAALAEEKAYASPEDIPEETIKQMIILLSSLSFRQSLACLAQLDKDVKMSDLTCWCAAIYKKCLELVDEASSSSDKNLIAHANIIIDRIKVAVKTDLLIKLFSNPKIIKGVL